MVKSGTIIEAVDNQPWSGEANVHVSIVNWVKHPAPTTKSGRISITTEEALQLPHSRRLWRKVDPSLPLFDGEQANGSRRRETTVMGKHGRTRKDKSYELTVSDVAHVSSTLSDQTDVSGAKVLKCNTEPQRVYQGQVPGHEAFVLSPSEAASLIRRTDQNAQVIWPFLIGRDIVTGSGEPSRFVIDFQDIDINAASAFAEPFKRIKEEVLPIRQKAASEGHTADGKPRPHHQLFLRYWWRHSYDRPELISTISPLSRYVVCSGVTKRPIFAFVSNRIRPDHAVFVFAFEDDYSFGILQSQAHWLWFTTKCSKLKSDYRYTPPTVFDTLPWPQAVTKKQVRAVAKAGFEIRRLRNDALLKTSGGLRGLYRTLELPGKSELRDAHAALDAAVLEAYGFNPKKDLLAQLLLLNLDVAARIDRGEPVTAPGVPPLYGDATDLVTGDCIRPPA
ncbi:hypothetical protein JYU07_00645 [Roseiflexus sp. AH-315-K22]|nr:hypothetical protein [Roseiflexus sp. AH-315-K22]